MGNTWTVQVWGDWWGGGDLGYLQVWQGESFIGALLSLWKHRNEGTGCLKLEWRPHRSE